MLEKAGEGYTKIVRVKTKKELALARQLFIEYAESLNFNLCFQDFESELENLQEFYASPEGRILLATYRGQAAGCVALRKISKDVCEMKRLYVKPQYRRKGVGRALALAIIEKARRIGYRRMRLDTVPSMKEAIALYRSMGFRNIEPYRFNPIEGAAFLELQLV